MLLFFHLFTAVCKKFETVTTKYLSFCPTKVLIPCHIYYPGELVLPRKLTDYSHSHKLEINLNQLLSNCKRLSQLNTVMFTNFVWWNLSNLEGPIASLVDLEIRTSHPTLSNLSLNTLLSKCVNLERLQLWEFSRLNINLESIGNNVTQLDLLNHSSDVAVLKLLRAVGPRLKYLKIENSKFNSSTQSRIDKISSENLNRIIEYCPNLKSLNLINYIMLGNLGRFTALRGLKQIIIDASRADYRFSNVEFTQILLNNPGLTHLTIPIAVDEFMEFLRSCQTYCPSIQYLDSLTAQLYDEITMDSIMRIWSKFTNLYELNKCTKHKFSSCRRQVLPFGPLV